MKVLIATDAWRPQVNGVVRSLEHLAAEARGLGVELCFLTPESFRSVSMPTYPEIRLSLAGAAAVRRHIDQLRPTHIHIATEGPIGLATRLACLKEDRSFTTSFHTRFPQYVRARLPVPEAVTYLALRVFHNAGRGVMVSGGSLEDELLLHGFRNVMRWSRGVDVGLFRPRPGADLGVRRPVFLYVGRLAVEKNVGAFLALDLPGTKAVVGEGPARPALEKLYPSARFLGQREGEALAEIYAAADVFVFPSRTDTFGVVLLEALASGVPIAAYPVMGPIDVLGTSGTGVLDGDLRTAAIAALAIPRHRCTDYSLGFSWGESARQFFQNVCMAQQAA
jgi:glycosyltransferase involved in cell wall biosynthesis